MTVARASKLYLPTLRDAPADAEAVSHKLLVRAGFIRQLCAGLWTFTPLGWRVHRKVEQVIREELDAIGAQEWLAPVLTPVELWETTGRDKIPEIFHLHDRAGRHFVLPMTHEETFTFHARELQSYRQLPQAWYHFQTKDRDEPRPRGGLIRARVHHEGLVLVRPRRGRAGGELPRARGCLPPDLRALRARVPRRAGGVGDDGRQRVGRLPRAVRLGREHPSSRARTGTSRPISKWPRAVPRPPEFPPRLEAPEEVETPGITTCEALATFLGIDLAATSKAMPVTKEDGTVLLALVRGDDRLELAKLMAALGEAVRPSTEDEIKAAFGAEPGSLGPVGFRGEVIADETLREGQFVAGANRTGWHLRGVEHGRDFEARFADIRVSVEGDRCVKCGGELKFQTAIEIGHIFKLGTRYSIPLEATFLDEDGQEKPLVMGSYGIGLARVMAAAVEQRHDDEGIHWPRSLTPYDVHVVALPGVEEQAEQAAERLSAAGADVLLDDRDLRAGEKFADADLIGIPTRVTLGRKTLEDGKVDVKDRKTGAEERVEVAELGKEAFSDGEAT